MKLGIIGNCQYSALVSTHGEISWLCWPRFDSNFVFGSLVYDGKGGSFRVAPARSDAEGHQEYVVNSNVLRTRFESEDGAFEIIDFAPRFHHHDRYFKPTMLVRVLVPLRGEPLVRVTCTPRADNGAVALQPTLWSNHINFVGGPEQLRLTTDLSLTCLSEGRAFSLSRRRYMVLTWGSPLEAPLRSTCEDFLFRTIEYWRRWVKHCHLPPLYQKEVIRSALALKLHQFEDTGAVIAATTTSIPEAPGSERNWDYRYCWVRDAFFTVQALQTLSHFEELEGFESFLKDVVRRSNGTLQPVYAVSGETELTERSLSELSGYRQHAPVRFGNDAFRQSQHDVYGQALMALQPLFTDVRFLDDANPVNIDIILTLLDSIERTFDSPDAGIWEFRGIERQHAFTKLMHWAGARAAARMARSAGLVATEHKAQTLENRARTWLDRIGHNDELGTLSIAPGVAEPDASLLLAVNLGLYDPKDPRAAALVDVVKSKLSSHRGLIRRYAFDDGMGAATTCFTVCSFWFVEALARIGRRSEAKDVFELVLKHANHLGLFSEDVDVDSGELWGNFPQTYTHVGLIGAAFALGSDDEEP